MKAPTIKDVARAANVGVGTVSRVINNSAMVSEDTRQRVLDAIDALGYTPNLAARQLSKGVTHSIGVLSPFFTLPSFNHRLAGMQNVLQASEYDLTLHSVRSPEHFKIKARALMSKTRVDGLLMLTPPNLPETIWQANSQMPLMLVDSDPIYDRPSIVIDNVAGGELAAQFLIERGYRSLGFLGDLLEDDFGYTTTQKRFRGFCNAVEAAGLPLDKTWHRFCYLSNDLTRAAAHDLLTMPNRPDAIFATSDMKAFEVLHLAAELGMRVPDDVAVIGFDDIDMAHYMQLTTVRQPLVESGEIAARLMLDWCENGQPPPLEPQVLPLSIVERATA